MPYRTHSSDIKQLYPHQTETKTSRVYLLPYIVLVAPWGILLELYGVDGVYSTFIEQNVCSLSSRGVPTSTIVRRTECFVCMLKRRRQLDFKASLALLNVQTRTIYTLKTPVRCDACI